MDGSVPGTALRRSFIRFPTQVEFGRGTLRKLGELAAPYGKRAYCLFDPFFQNSQAAETALSALHQAGVATVECYEFRPNPRAADIDARAEACRTHGCDVVIAMGGGGILDIGKAVAFLVTNGGGAWDYTVKENQSYCAITASPLPFIAVPTTAGTGSEATIYSVINNPEIQRKCTIRSFSLYPKLAVIDPELMLDIPPHLTALTGIDTFAHAFESYTNKNATLFSKMLARESIRLFVENIVRCTEVGTDIDARANMAFASLLGGMAIAHAPTTLPHIIGQCLSGWVDAPHGGSLAACLAQVIRWTLPAGQSEFAELARIISPDLISSPDPAAAAALPDLVDALFQRILGNQPVTLRTYGMPEARAREFSDFIFDNYQGDMQNYLRVPTREELYQIICACM